MLLGYIGAVAVLVALYNVTVAVVGYIVVALIDIVPVAVLVALYNVPVAVAAFLNYCYFVSSINICFCARIWIKIGIICSNRCN